MEPTVDGSRVELILGRLHVTPAPSGPHQWATGKLARLLDDAVTAAGRSDLYVVPAVNVEISRSRRTALIPDVVLLGVEPRGLSFAATDVRLVGEVWSSDNDLSEREAKFAAYAGAGVPFVWTVDQDRLAEPTVTAYRLDDGRYAAVAQVESGSPATITAAPVPVRVDPSVLAL